MGVGGGYYKRIDGIARNAIPSQKLKDKAIAIDSSMLIHKWSSRDPEAINVRLDYTKIKFWFQRFAVDLHGLRIKAIFCFDGKACPNKQREAAGRAERRQTAFIEFQRTGEQDALRGSFCQSWELTRACIEALDEIGAEHDCGGAS